MNFLCAYFESFSCINAFMFKGLLGYKNPVPTYNTPKEMVLILPLAKVVPVLKRGMTLR
jgi:hypothetical protein